jgi:hypothetical protein
MQAAVYVSSALDLNNLNNSSAKINKEDARRTKYTICSDSESLSITTIRKRVKTHIVCPWIPVVVGREDLRLAATRQKFPKATCYTSSSDNHHIFIVKTMVLSITI